MECEITHCYRCGRDMSGDRWKLTAMRCQRPYSWRTVSWNRYYCTGCASHIMESIEDGDAEWPNT